MRIFADDQCNLPDLAPERCGDPQFGAPTPGRQGQLARGPEPPAQRNAEALNVRLGSGTAPTKRWWRKAAPVF